LTGEAGAVVGFNGTFLVGVEYSEFGRSVGRELGDNKTVGPGEALFRRGGGEVVLPEDEIVFLIGDQLVSIGGM